MTRRITTATVATLATLALTWPTGSPRAEGVEASLPPADVVGVLASEPAPSIAIDFAPGSAWLSERAITAIDYFTYYHVIKGPVERVRIILHPDPTGRKADRPGLADRRAEAVAAYIESKGVPRTAMAIEIARQPTAADDRDMIPAIDVFTR